MSENIGGDPTSADQSKTLSRERNVLREGFRAESYQTLLDVLSYPVDRINRKIRGESRPAPFEVSIFILAIFVLGLGFGVSALIGEVQETRIRVLEVFNVVISFCLVRPQ